MKIIRAANELKAGGHKVCLAIGFFDGVHLGHQQIIRQTIADARQHDALALVLTFDRHPNTIVAPDRVPPLIYSLPQKLRVIESLGVDTLLLIPFDKQFSRQTGEEFIRRLARETGQIQSLCVGADFVFGHHRSGNVPLLKQLAGRVIKGQRLGQQLGFPTANLDVAGLALPPKGVYAGHVNVDGKAYRAALNIGLRPTVSSEAQILHAEAHLLNFNGNLYNRELEVEIGDKLREEKKFASKAELREQIALDIAAISSKP
jgi:riboflavin kinase / FMN adenylyltransferase